jgi:Kef-type K+ transport system membrane component KefB
MTSDFLSLFVIAVVAAVCPVVAQSIPKKPIPETVFLLVAGALLGPYLAGLIQVDDVITFLSDLGLSLLFLLAGYEINPRTLTGSQGRRGLVTWFVTFGIALVLMFSVPRFRGGADPMEPLSLAIMLTTTALGTLIPILKERELLDTPIGESVLAYGTWGELAPVLAIAILLSSRSTWQTAVILLALVALCVFIATHAANARKSGGRLYRFLADKADSTSQPVVRIVLLILVTLVAFSSVFDLDIVLGAFAAGFVLRFIVPDGNKNLETKLDAIGYGFFIPLFFVVSGAKVDLAAVGQNPQLLIGFILGLLLIRAVPIYVALKTGSDTRGMSARSRASVALYCTTALPLIVAVTSLATKAGALSDDTASVLVAAGALTVLIMPLLAQLTYRVADGRPAKAVVEIAHDPRHAGEILRDHHRMQQIIAGNMSDKEAARMLAQRAHERIDQLDEHDVELLRRIAVERARRRRDIAHIMNDEAARRAIAAEFARVAQLRNESIEAIIRDLVGDESASGKGAAAGASANEGSDGGAAGASASEGSDGGAAGASASEGSDGAAAGASADGADAGASASDGVATGRAGDAKASANEDVAAGSVGAGSKSGAVADDGKQSAAASNTAAGAAESDDAKASVTARSQRAAAGGKNGAPADADSGAFGVVAGGESAATGDVAADGESTATSTTSDAADVSGEGVVAGANTDSAGSTAAGKNASKNGADTATCEDGTSGHPRSTQVNGQVKGAQSAEAPDEATDAPDGAGPDGAGLGNDPDANAERDSDADRAADSERDSDADCVADAAVNSHEEADEDPADGSIELPRIMLTGDATDLERAIPPIYPTDADGSAESGTSTTSADGDGESQSSK